MSVLSAVLDATASGAVEIVDLTTPLQESTPILRLPEPFGNTSGSARGDQPLRRPRPAWYWNDIHTGEHTGTHFDAPVHWVTGRDGLDVSQAAAHAGRPRGGDRQVGRGGATRTSCSRSSTSQAWRPSTAAAGRRLAAVPAPAGTAARRRTRGFLNADENGPHTPACPSSARRWLARGAADGFGVETVGTDAGAAHAFDPPFSCHNFLLGAGK
jgi:kynurenine formamidase